ncbi:DUF4158 domain-containing protein [Streptomyces sp. NPDC055109]
MEQVRAEPVGLRYAVNFFEAEARFPESAEESPTAAVAYVAQQVKVPAELWAGYDWQGRAITRHQAEIRGRSVPGVSRGGPGEAGRVVDGGAGGPVPQRPHRAAGSGQGATAGGQCRQGIRRQVLRRDDGAAVAHDPLAAGGSGCG